MTTLLTNDLFKNINLRFFIYLMCMHINRAYILSTYCVDLTYWSYDCLAHHIWWGDWDFEPATTSCGPPLQPAKDTVDTRPKIWQEREMEQVHLMFNTLNNIHTHT